MQRPRARCTAQRIPPSPPRSSTRVAPILTLANSPIISLAHDGPQAQEQDDDRRPQARLLLLRCVCLVAGGHPGRARFEAGSPRQTSPTSRSSC